MKWPETIHFNERDYRRKIRKPDYTHYELVSNIYRKRRNIASSTTSMVTSVATAPVAGIGVVGLAWSARNMSVDAQKLRLLEKEWARRGQKPLPKRPIKDTLIPVLMTTAVGIFAPFVDIGMDKVEEMAWDVSQEVTDLAMGTYADCVESGIISVGEKVWDTIGKPPKKYK